MDKRVFVIVIDGFGCGALPDAEEYGDSGANTVANVARVVGGIDVPALQRLGLGNIVEIQGCPPAKRAEANFGKMAEHASAKDTMTGYWEMLGLRVEETPRTFHDGFPAELIAKFEDRCGRKVTGNKAASGTEIIEELGPRQLETGELIADYSEEARGHSCLILGSGPDGRPIHVVCSPKEDFLAIITAYVPGAAEWEDDSKTRRRS